MPKHFYVDYENTKAAGLKGLLSLKKEDTVTILYTKNADTMPFSLHENLNKAHCDVIIRQVECGTPNALDFQLSSLLGFDIHGYPADSFRIVSKDTGYKCLCTFWSKSNPSADVRYVSDLTEASVLTMQDRVNTVAASVELQLSKEEVNFIAGTIGRLKTKDGIHNALVKKYGNNERTSKIYGAIKPLLTDKKSPAASK